MRATVLVWMLFLSLLAAPAHGVTLTTPDLPAVDAAAPALAQRVEALYQQFRAFQDRLPFQVGAGLYLWYFQPLSRDTTLAGGSLEGTLQTFFYYFKLDAEVHQFGAHLETRMRDGGHLGPTATNNFFRGFYSSNIWVQEGYVFYSPWKTLTLKAGKVYRRVGIFWDDSFFGNIQFYDGLKLNPDYGASLEGETALLGGAITLSYAAQFFLNSDGVNGGLDYGRLVAGTPGNIDAARVRSPNPEGELDSTGAHMGALRNLFVGRFVLGLHPHSSKAFGAEIGASGLTGSVQRVSMKDMINDEARITHASGDVTFNMGPVLLYCEYLRQFGPGVRDADYVLMGVRGGWRWLSLRFNASYVDYHLGPDVEEVILQPGLTARIGAGLSLMMEWNEWQRRDPRLADPGFTGYDRSLNTSLIYSF